MADPEKLKRQNEARPSTKSDKDAAHERTGSHDELGDSV